MGRLDQLRETQETLKKEKAELEVLLESPGWLWLKRTLEEQVRARRIMDFNADLDSVDAAFRSAKMRGEISGIETARVLVYQYVEELNMNLAQIETEIEEEQRDE